jgi:hypothetical protein
VNKETYRGDARGDAAKCPEQWVAKDWKLLHENAPAGHLFLMQQELTKHSTVVLQHLPYLSDLSPCSFFLFLKMRQCLQGCCFNSEQEIIAAIKDALHAIQTEKFQNCFQQLYQWWQKCVTACGLYFERAVCRSNPGIVLLYYV